MPTRVHQPGAARLPRDLIARWADVPASVAADVLAGLTVVDPAIRPLRPFADRGRLVGSIVTAFCEGTDYGAQEVPLTTKVFQVRQQLDAGTAVIVYASSAAGNVK